MVICWMCACSASGQLEEPVSVLSLGQPLPTPNVDALLKSMTSQIDPCLSCTDEVTTGNDPDLSEIAVFG